MRKLFVILFALTLVVAACDTAPEVAENDPVLAAIEALGEDVKDIGDRVEALEAPEPVAAEAAEAAANDAWCPAPGIVRDVFVAYAPIYQQEVAANGDPVFINGQMKMVVIPQNRAVQYVEKFGGDPYKGEQGAIFWGLSSTYPDEITQVCVSDYFETAGAVSNVVLVEGYRVPDEAVTDDYAQVHMLGDVETRFIPYNLFLNADDLAPLLLPPNAK